MKKYKIPILTEEYFINVFIGSREELIKFGEEYCSDKNFSNFMTGRGLCVNGFDFEPKRPPAIFVIKNVGIPTLAHEASHAMRYISEYLNLKDINGEFEAHGIAAVLRGVLKGKEI